MVTRRAGLGGLLTALVLALAVAVPGGAAHAVTHPQRTSAASNPEQNAHPSARSQAAHVAPSTKTVHHLDATTPPSGIDAPVERGVIVVERTLTGLAGLASSTALGRGPPAP